MKYFLFGAIVVCAVAVSACSSSDPSATSSSTTAPTAAATTENFSGSVQVGGSDSRPFTVTVSGATLSATLTAAGPPATIFMGFGVGSWSGTTCTLLTGGFTNAQASTTPQLSGTISSGSYCLMVYDIGNMTAPVSYTWTMTHY